MSTMGITYAGNIKGWPKDSRAEVIVSNFAADRREETLQDFQWAEIRGGVHGGDRSSESHDHVTVRYTDITGDKYDAHVAVTGQYGIDQGRSQIWKVKK